MALEQLPATGVLSKYTICTSSTHPGSPSQGDMIYETDTGKTLVYQGATDTWTPPWNTPWGWIAEATSTSLSTGAISTATDLLSLTFTAIANRRYKYTFSGICKTSQSTGQPIVQIMDGSNVVHGSPDEIVTPDPTLAGSTFLGVSYETGIAAGSTTRKMRFTAIGVGGTATFTASADIPFRITVEDVGPNGNPS